MNLWQFFDRNPYIAFMCVVAVILVGVNVADIFKQKEPSSGCQLQLGTKVVIASDAGVPSPSEGEKK